MDWNRPLIGSGGRHTWSATDLGDHSRDAHICMVASQRCLRAKIAVYAHRHGRERRVEVPARQDRNALSSALCG
jgi:hypothetical protein